jgi:hypothetical protein
VIVLRDPDNAGKWLEVRELQAGGPALNLALEIVDVRNAEEIGALLSRSLLTEGPLTFSRNGQGTLTLVWGEMTEPISQRRPSWVD